MDMSTYRQYGAIMDTLSDIPELNATEIARQLRMHMGDVKLSRVKLSEATGISRSSLAAKLDGEVEFTLTEIALIAEAINQSWLAVLTGTYKSPPPHATLMRKRGSKKNLRLPRLDSNQEPVGLRPRRQQRFYPQYMISQRQCTNSLRSHRYLGCAVRL